MGDFYAAGEYDLAGFIVGTVERDRIVDGSRTRPGDVLLGLASSGLHTNGYSLARRIVFERMGLTVDDPFPGEEGSVADVLLRIHRSYLRGIWPLLERGLVRGLAHITGGGIPGNLPRVLPAGCGALIDAASWVVPPLFRTLQQAGGVEEEEMRRVFNMGVGMIVICAPEDRETVMELLSAAGETPWELGRVEAGEGVRYAG
jgi:phosphoribosylformylglycinamidine cyclo-ligase